jgi:hypothetical protein
MPFEDATKEVVRETLLDARARDIIQLIRVLVSQVGKDKAKELIKKARWEDWFQRGKATAEKLGHPQDLDSYLKEYFGTQMANLPFLAKVDPSKFEEKTKTRAVCTSRDYCIGRAIAKLGDEMIREICKEAYCIHDIAWAEGFNPKINTKISKIFYNGDDCCQFVWEMKP